MTQMEIVEGMRKLRKRIGPGKISVREMVRGLLERWKALSRKSARGPQFGPSRYRLLFWPTSFARTILAILAIDSSAR